MNRGPAALHRLSILLLGLICLVVGVSAVLYEAGVKPITTWLDKLDVDAVSRFAATDWWVLVLLGIAVVALIWGWVLIATAIRPDKVGDVVLAGSGADGVMTVPPKQIAGAVAEELSAERMFAHVDAKALDDRGRDIIRVTVTARPTHSYQDIAAALAPAVEHVRDAVAGSGVHVQALVKLENPKQ